MFSKEFMSFLVKYGEEERYPKEENTVKEISFRDNRFAKLAYATVVVKR